jgi:excinuclease ABC subunit A
VLQKLVNRGNTVIIIEHNMDVIKVADYVIDMGPEGGQEGGRILVEGTPEEIIKSSTSYTAQFLKPELEV